MVDKCHGARAADLTSANLHVSLCQTGRPRATVCHATLSYEECPFGCAVADAQLAAGGAHALIQVQLADGYGYTEARSTGSFAARCTIGGASATVQLHR